MTKKSSNDGELPSFKRKLTATENEGVYEALKDALAIIAKEDPHNYTFYEEDHKSPIRALHDRNTGELEAFCNHIHNYLELMHYLLQDVHIKNYSLFKKLRANESVIGVINQYGLSFGGTASTERGQANKRAHDRNKSHDTAAINNRRRVAQNLQHRHK